MQFGCLAFEEIIQVSDQPVVPSLGTVAPTGTLFAESVFTWYCQVVPSTELPLVKAWISFVASVQYSPATCRCFLSSSTAALNCVSSSSYGFVIFRFGRVALRYTAASAI